MPMQHQIANGDLTAEQTKSRRAFMQGAALGVAGLAAAGAAAGAAQAAEVTKEVQDFGVPWEALYGYSQAVKVGDTLYLSGQLSHDEAGNLIAPAPLDASGKVTDFGNMEAQMRQTYVNAQALLARYGATLANVVEEVLYVIDMDAAFAVAGTVRKAAYGVEKPAVASTILTTSRLALREQLLEIKFIARI